MTNPQKEAFEKASRAASDYANALRGIACKFPRDAGVRANVTEALALQQRARAYVAGAYDWVLDREFKEGY